MHARANSEPSDPRPKDGEALDTPSEHTPSEPAAGNPCAHIVPCGSDPRADRSGGHVRTPEPPTAAVVVTDPSLGVE